MKTARLGTAFALSLLVAAPLHAAKEHHKTLPLEPGGTFTVHNYKGSITVTAGSQNEVRIDVRVEPDGDDEDQLRKVEETEIEFSGGGRSVTVRTDYAEVKKRNRGFFSGWNEDGRLPLVRYTITMPKTARLVIEDYKSDIAVSGIAGELDVETYKGEVRIKGVEAAARFETYKGTMRVDVAQLGGDLDISTYKGSYEIELPKASRFTLDADTGKRGSLESDFEMTSGARRREGRRSERVSGQVNGGGPRIDFETYKGSLTLREK
jgi:hypothetical protein